MGSGLVGKLRSRIKDERYKTAAFTLTVSDTGVSSAIVEVTPQRFIVTLVGGTAPSLDLSLEDDRYETVGRLARAIDAVDGYDARLDEDVENEHSSQDMAPIPPTEMVANTVPFHTRLFSDQELSEFLAEAVSRHNPSYTLASLPAEEVVFVLQLAQAVILRVQASDAAKRKNLGQSVEDLLSLASSYEEAYNADVTRNQRVIASPTLSHSQQNIMREGDVVLGALYRKSPRNGYMTPMAHALPPEAAVLLEPMPGDVEDDNAALRWLRNTQSEFYTYELWRDTVPEVTRSRQIILFSERDIDPVDLRTSKFDRPTTSKLVFRSFGPNATRETKAFTAYVEAFGQLVNQFIDRNEQGDGNIGLEPESEYFYRLYIVNVNGDATQSNVMRIRTLPKRARFTDDSGTETLEPADVLNVITAAKDSGATIIAYANDLVSNCKLKVGGKVLDSQIVAPGSPGTIQGTLPTFTVGGEKDVVLESPTGLFDLMPKGITLT